MFLNTRRLFVLVLFGALFLMTTREISDPDFWWHLRAGQYIVETRTIAHVDIFSFTNAGKEWVMHEWLSEVIIYLLYRAGSFALLVAVFAVVITTSFVFAFWRSEARPYIAGFAVLLGALATAPTWGVRPQMLSLLFTSAYLLLLDKYRERSENRYIAPLVPLMFLWVNLHSGFALGLVIIAVYVIGQFIQDQINGKFALQVKANKKLVVVLVLCGLAVMLNPNGIRMYSYPFETLASATMQRYIQEWFSPDFHSVEWQPFALMLLGLIGTGMWARARVPVAWIILTIIFAFAGLRSARLVPIFAVVAIPVLACQISAVLGRAHWNQPRPAVTRSSTGFQLINLLVLIVLAGAIVLRFLAVGEAQAKSEQHHFPTGAVAYIQSHSSPGNIYNAYNWGGYLIWRLYPDRRVYVDGRADLYGDQFIEDYLKVYRGEPGWEEQLDRKSIQFVLLEREAPLASVIDLTSGWSKVYEDSQAVIYEKSQGVGD